jgi:hypothetical protein
MRRYGHVELCWVKVREIIQAEGSLVAVDAFDFLAAVSRPKRPKDEVAPNRVPPGTTDMIVFRDAVSEVFSGNSNEVTNCQSSLRDLIFPFERLPSADSARNQRMTA